MEEDIGGFGLRYQNRVTFWAYIKKKRGASHTMLILLYQSACTVFESYLIFNRFRRMYARDASVALKLGQLSDEAYITMSLNIEATQ